MNKILRLGRYELEFSRKQKYKPVNLKRDFTNQIIEKYDQRQVRVTYILDLKHPRNKTTLEGKIEIIENPLGFILKDISDGNEKKENLRFIPFYTVKKFEVSH